MQFRRAYRYTFLQSERHGLCDDHRAYPHTRVKVSLDEGLHRASTLRAFMTGVPYARYESHE